MNPVDLSGHLDLFFSRVSVKTGAGTSYQIMLDVPQHLIFYSHFLNGFNSPLIVFTGQLLV